MKHIKIISLILALSASSIAFAQSGGMTSMDGNMPMQNCMGMQEMKGMDMKNMDPQKCKDMMNGKGNKHQASDVKMMMHKVDGPLGSPAAGSFAQRTINLLPDTRYVNVEQGETIKFSSGGKTFTWNFDTLGTPTFNLAKIAPKDINSGNIQVYVSRNPLYSR
jgi:hypothetical protein